MAAKMPDYDVSHCEAVIDCLSLGHTLAAFAGEVRVPRTTLLAWAKVHPEFARAVKVAQARAVAFWEDALAEIARSGKGSATAATFALKNCIAEETAEIEGGATAAPSERWSDLEIARRIAHILTSSRYDEAEGNVHDAAIS
jgi:hypothetical protein